MRAYVVPQKYYLAVAFILAGLVFVQTGSFYSAGPQIYVFTGGKGPVVVLESTTHQAFLIDTGSGESVLRYLGETLPWWQRDLKGIVLTGPASTYAGAKPDVARRYQVGAVVTFGTPSHPYGVPLHFGRFILTVYAPGVSSILYADASLSLSSSTPSGTYRLAGSTAWTRLP